MKGKIKLLNKLPIGHTTMSIDVMLEDKTYRLVKNDSNWTFENENDHHLLRLSVAIGKVISLRYRI